MSTRVILSPDLPTGAETALLWEKAPGNLGIAARKTFRNRFGFGRSDGKILRQALFDEAKSLGSLMDPSLLYFFSPAGTEVTSGLVDRVFPMQTKSLRADPFNPANKLGLVTQGRLVFDGVTPASVAGFVSNMNGGIADNLSSITMASVSRVNVLSTTSDNAAFRLLVGSNEVASAGRSTTGKWYVKARRSGGGTQQKRESTGDAALGWAAMVATIDFVADTFSLDVNGVNVISASGVFGSTTPSTWGLDVRLIVGLITLTPNRFNGYWSHGLAWSRALSGPEKTDLLAKLRALNPQLP